MTLTPVQQVLADAVVTGEVPSAVAVVGNRKEAHPVGAFGLRRYDKDDAVTPETRYDLASLSKVVATLPAILKLIDAGELELDSPVKRFFSNAGWMQTPSLGDATIRQLLTHSSGLSAWKPLFALTNDRQIALANVLQSGLEHPSGTYIYSDLGFILLGFIIERVSGMREDAFVKQHIHEPLEMHSTSYGAVGENIAATEDCGWRNRVLEGIVHDENAYALGGVAGHAGLFGTAADLARYAQAWLNLDPRLASEGLLLEATRPHTGDHDTLRGLGWVVASPGAASSGKLRSERAYGHTGFTGTSLWLDPEADWFAVLLTNRIHPTREGGANIQTLRASFHDAVARAAQPSLS